MKAYFQIMKTGRHMEIAAQFIFGSNLLILKGGRQHKIERTS